MFYPSRVPYLNSTEYLQYNLQNSSEYSGGGSLGRTALQQGGYQFAALILTLALAVISGAITGFLIKLVSSLTLTSEDHIAHEHEYFKDKSTWILPQINENFINNVAACSDRNPQINDVSTRL